MSRKGKKGHSQKLRVEFKRNRTDRTREKDWTERYRAEAEKPAEEQTENQDDTENDGDQSDAPRRRRKQV